MVAKGTKKSPSACCPLTRMGPPMPSGTCVAPTRFSMLPRVSSGENAISAVASRACPVLCASQARRIAGLAPRIWGMKHRLPVERLAANDTTRGPGAPAGKPRIGRRTCRKRGGRSHDGQARAGWDGEGAALAGAQFPHVVADADLDGQVVATVRATTVSSLPSSVTLSGVPRNCIGNDSPSSRSAAWG